MHLARAITFLLTLKESNYKVNIFFLYNCFWGHSTIQIIFSILTCNVKSVLALYLKIKDNYNFLKNLTKQRN